VNPNLKKGIILAGGSGSRLYPVTLTTSKQLLPVYDKPMIYYPLSTLMMFGLKDILIISTPDDTPRFKELLGDGSRLGINISYKIQPRPEGIAQAFILSEEFIGGDNVVLILGDNIFYGVDTFVRAADDFENGAQVFGYYVKDPERYGVVGFNSDGSVKAIIEKPKSFESNYAVTGLYIYDNRVIEYAKSLKPSGRGELEITDVNNAYLKDGNLQLVKLNRGVAWLDTGTHESMIDAGNFIATIEKRQGIKIACIEEVALKMNFIGKAKLASLTDELPDNEYKKYLLKVLNEADDAS